MSPSKKLTSYARHSESTARARLGAQQPRGLLRRRAKLSTPMIIKTISRPTGIPYLYSASVFVGWGVGVISSAVHSCRANAATANELICGLVIFGYERASQLYPFETARLAAWTCHLARGRGFDR